MATLDNSTDTTLKGKIGQLFQCHSTKDIFNGLTTEHLQKAFFKEEFHLLEPVERRLGHRIITTIRNGRPIQKAVWDMVYDIPLIESLGQLLSDSFILGEVLCGHHRRDELLSDYCDGTVFKSHDLFSTVPSSLEILAYYDDVEVCNPLGSRAKKHKLALFYYTLGNIPPMYRSNLQCIQLFAVVKSAVLQKYGADTILETFMDGIKSLEKDEGVTIVINGQAYTFRGTLALVSGDNLASHYLGGYKSLSSALRKCRHCMAVADDMTTEFTSEAFQSRTRETHASQCASLSGPLKEHFATTYGLHRDSILNTSRYFHVTEGLVPDIMHDVLEGCLAYEVKELLKYLISSSIITLSELNRIMASFPYTGSDSRNKPTPLSSTTLSSSDHNLKQTGMYMYVHVLPYMPTL
jgi:hypothetical protein